MIGGIGIVHVIAVRTTAHRVLTTLVGYPVRIPPEIQPFHFQEDLQSNNRDPMRRPPHPIHKKRERLGLVNQGKEIRTPSSRCGGPRCERDMCVMMVVRGVDIVHVIAMGTTAFRVPTTVVSIPVQIPVRIPPEIQLFHFQEDLQRNNRGPMRRPPHPIHKKETVRVGNQRECKSEPLQPSWGT